MYPSPLSVILNIICEYISFALISPLTQVNVLCGLIPEGPMYICLCRGITDSQIQSAIKNGAQTLSQLRKNLGVAGQCGKCACSAQELLDAAKNNNQNHSLFYALAS